MRKRPITFFSQGLRIDGDLYLPDDRPEGERVPAVVACSGYQGLKDIHPARFARTLVPEGYACLAFDYRGFGRSEGARGRLVPQEQVEDVHAAVSFLETCPEVDPERIALVGWALGGGVVVSAAADDERVRAVAALNPIGDGRRSTRAMHTDPSWRGLLARIAEDRRRRAARGDSTLVHPFEVIRLDEVTRAYVDAELYRAPGFGSEVTLESADSLLRFHPELDVARIAPRPLLLVHGEENALHLPSESEELFARAGEPKRLVRLPGGHTEWMFDDHPTFRRLGEELRGFLAGALGAREPLTAGSPRG
jgi:alpha-beta hydrolase superfamily lysophospholipase